MADPSRLPSRPKLSSDSVARGLGWLSIGLGVWELLMPRAFARGLGMRGRAGLIRAYGVREIVTGVGILSAKRRSAWLWGRVAGDALGIAILGRQLGSRNPRRATAALALAAVGAVTAVDIANAATMRQKEAARRATRDYSDRSGFPRPPDEMRGVARGETLQQLPREPVPVQPRLSG
jgi:hypothetical protein